MKTAIATNDFLWAVGVEDTFIPQTRAGLRALDEYELTQHYHLWREDLDRIADLGVTHIRWGVPWYRVQPAPDRFAWGWIDEVLDYLVNEKRVRPIIDLMHYGTPLWMDNSFLNVDYPHYVAEYAHAFAERYRDLVQFYTPLNEPTVNADYCGRRAEWPPYLEDDDGYVALLLQLTRGVCLTAQALRTADPDAVLVQVEATAWHWTQTPGLQPEVERRQAHTYLAFDLFTGGVGADHPLRSFLVKHGVAEQDLAWLAEHRADIDVFGVNLYPWSGGELVSGADGTPHVKGELAGRHLEHVLRETWDRYRLPLMVTETSAARDVAGRARWMDQTIAAVRSAQDDDIPVIGYTWFPVFTMIDWAYRRSRGPLHDYLLHLGLWECSFDGTGVLQRHPTPLVDRYRNYVKKADSNKDVIKNERTRL